MIKFSCLAVFLLVLSAISAEAKNEIKLLPQGGGRFDVEKKIGSVYSDDSLIPSEMATVAFLCGRAEKREVKKPQPTWFWGFNLDQETIINSWTCDGKMLKKLNVPSEHKYTPNFPGRIVFFLLLAFAGFFSFIYKFNFNLPVRKPSAPMKQLIVFFTWMAVPCLLYAHAAFAWKDFALIELAAMLVAAMLLLWKKIAASNFFYGFHWGFFWIAFIFTFILFFKFLNPVTAPIIVALLLIVILIAKFYMTKKVAEKVQETPIED